MWPHYTDLGLTFKTYCQECYEKVKAEAEEQAIEFYKQVNLFPETFNQDEQ